MILVYGKELDIKSVTTESKSEFSLLLNTWNVSSIVLNHFVCNEGNREVIETNILLTLELIEIVNKKVNILILYPIKGRKSLTYDMTVGAVDTMIRVLSKHMIINSINPNGAIAQFNHRTDIVNEITYPEVVTASSVCKIKKASLLEMIIKFTGKNNVLTGMLVVMSEKSDVVRYR